MESCGSQGSPPSPKDSQVPDMNCDMPIAPTGDCAFGFQFDSAWICAPITLALNPDSAAASSTESTYSSGMLTVPVAPELSASAPDGTQTAPPPGSVPPTFQSRARVTIASALLSESTIGSFSTASTQVSNVAFRRSSCPLIGV